MKEYIFSAEIAVRDYELDCEGVVNNANYLHYLEHTRHLFCEWAGFSFKQMQEQGIDPMLNRIEVDYRRGRFRLGHRCGRRREDPPTTSLWAGRHL